MRTMESPASLDLNLAQRADRKLRRFGYDLNRVLSVIVKVRGIPDFVSNEDEPQPMDPFDPRIEAAIKQATVKRGKDGLYHAETPAADGYWSDGKTRADALADLRDNLRYLISDPVKVKFFAYSKQYTAEARPTREGGFWATVPALDGASTQGDTMDELKYMLIDLAKIYTEEK
ncbi:MAG: type II toxin-antitoxin system HicB family antitoxin [Kiritimatiellae bacterium]|nr:type II toxin-antitoxin system HicB family antitoxin [Kiritimatiellia bacterium]